MGTGLKFARFGGALLLSAAVLCGGANAAQSHHKSKKKTPPPPLPSGPTGPVQQIPLDSIAAVAPKVTFQDNQLTIVAPNSTLADILRAVRKQTGAEIDVPAAPERVVTNLGPGPARDVLADLLNGSRFNYVLLGSPGNDAVLTRVVLVQKSAQQQQTMTANSQEPQPGAQAPNGQTPQADQDQSAQATDADASDDSATDDNNADQPAAEAEQQQPQDQQQQQQNVKTPQQMLQEMQQRQLMMQQGGQPVPGSGMPPHPPQQQ